VWNQSLIGSVVIDAKFDTQRTIVRFPATAIGMRLEPLDVRTDSKSDSTGSENQKNNKVVV
jgi:hypothetical protein